MRLRAVLLAALLSLTFAASASAASTTISVKAGAADDSPGTAANCAMVASGGYTCPTVRDAVALANTLDDDPTIDLGAGTFTLASGKPLELTEAMSISGAGDGSSGASTITPAGIATDANLSLTGLTLNGASEGCEELVESGASTSLTLNAVTVTNAECDPPPAAAGNTGDDIIGAAISAPDGVLTLTGSTVSDNSETAQTGGAGSGSTAPGPGGDADAVVDVGGLVMSDSLITHNSVVGGQGGGSTSQSGGAGGSVNGAGIEVASPSGPLTLSISASEFTDNLALGGAGGATSGANQGGQGGAVLGGGLYVDADASSGTATIADSTFSGNKAQSGQSASNTTSGGTGAPANFAGGARLYAAGTFPLNITDSTFSSNQSIVSPAGVGAAGQVGDAGAAAGGGLYLQFGLSAAIVNSTIVANTAQSGAGSPGTAGDEGGFGGGLDAFGISGLGLYSDTLSGNAVDTSLGAAGELGANLLTVSSPISLASDAIANALPAGAPNCAMQGNGVFKDLGHNLADATAASCGLSADGTDQIGPSGLPATPSANGASAVAATATTPAIPAPATLAPATGSLLLANGGMCLDPTNGNLVLTTDERGDPRPATCDIGAFQSQPLTVSGAPQVTGTPAVGQILTCATGSFATHGDGAADATGAIGAPTLGYAWTSGSRPVATTPTYTVAATDQGQAITCTETATGAYGHGSATSPAVSVPAAPAPSGPGASTGTELVLSHLHQTHATWSVKKVKHGPPVGTTFSYSLSLPAGATSAEVTFTFARVTRGRKVKGRCVAPTGRNRHARSCTLSTKVGSIAATGQSGSGELRFRGRVHGHTLGPGTYTVTVTARASNGATVAPQKLTFVIKR